MDVFFDMCQSAVDDLVRHVVRLELPEEVTHRLVARDIDTFWRMW